MSVREGTKGDYSELFRTTYTCATQIDTRSHDVNIWKTLRKCLMHLYMYRGPLEIIFNICTCMVGSLDFMHKYLILDETSMNKFVISLSHPCMYRRANSRVLEGVVLGEVTV